MIERYIELGALENLLTSTYAFADVFTPHLASLAMENGMNLVPHDDRPDLHTAHVGALSPDEDTLEDAVIHARSELLMARLLRSITPEVIERAASHFEEIATKKLAAASAMLERSGDGA